MNTRKRTAIGACLALLVAGLTGGFWADLGQPSHPQAATCHVFAGRAGQLPCGSANDPEDRMARQIVGTTLVGCAIGLASGGNPISMAWGCFSGAAGNILWN